MRAYIIRRSLLMIPTLIIASFLTFLMLRMIPGDIVDQMVAEIPISQSPKVTEELREKFREDLGLTGSLVVQYGRWIGDIILHGDFGNSMWTKTPVINEIAPRIPVTLELAFLAFAIIVIISLPLGIFSAVRQNSIADYLGRSFAILAMSLPVFWTGVMVMVFPAIWWRWSPPLMLITFAEDPLGNLRMFIIPAAILGLSAAGMDVRLIRTMMLEVLRQDYIRTAWSKGLREKEVVIKHAIKNSIIPVVSVWGLRIRSLIGGAVIVENIFAIPGLGRLTLKSILKRDYPIVIGITLILAIFIMFLNLFVDLLYAWLDPRTRSAASVSGGF